MRGIGCTLSRLSGTRAMLAWATFLAGAAAPAAHAQSAAQTAMAVPRSAPPNGAEVALPEPLDPSQAAEVRQIFLLQSQGKIAAAESATARLSDRTLLGSILAERYLGPYTNTSATQLEDWLRRFGDQAPAPAVYALLLRKLPRGASAPPPPHVLSLPTPQASEGSVEGIDDPVAAETEDISRLADVVAERAGDGATSSALRLISGTRGLTVAHVAALKAAVARALFADNRDEQALALAAGAFHAAKGADGASAYVAGLAAWRLGRLDKAREFFTSAAKAGDAKPALVSAASLWAARTALRLRRPHEWLPLMERAAANRDNFYGLLASYMLGIGIDPSGSRPTLGEADVDAVAATGAGWRAFALIEVGKPELAGAELATLWPAIQADHVFGRAVALVASHAGLHSFAANLSQLLAVSSANTAGTLPAEPLPRLNPAGGFTVDPALVYALTRIESNFNPEAVSAAGARGLMQLMPSTARVVSGNGASYSLNEPGLNLELGQRYLRYLADQETVQQDLLRLLGSYNTGPGNFASWARSINDQDDPLLFIEAIPSGQTRYFVEATLAYTWIYAMRFGLPVPSLDALAEGRFPRFTSEADPGKIMDAGLTLH